MCLRIVSYLETEIQKNVTVKIQCIGKVPSLTITTVSKDKGRKFTVLLLVEVKIIMDALEEAGNI